MIFNQDNSNIYMWKIEAQTEQEQRYLERLHRIFPELSESGKEVWGEEWNRDCNGNWICNPSKEDRAHLTPRTRPTL